MAFLEVLELGCRRCKKDVWCKAPLQIVGVNVIYDILVLYCTSGLEIYFFFHMEVCYLPCVFLASQWADGVEMFGVACSPTPEKQQIGFFPLNYIRSEL